MLKQNKIIAISILATVMCLTDNATAQDPVDFSGKWKLDLAASDPVDELLEAQGRSWMERKLAARTAVTQIIVQGDGEMKISIDSSVISKVEVLHLDGTPMKKKTKSGETVTVTTRWSDDGQTLLSETTVQTKSGPAPVVMERTLRDGGSTMILKTRMTLKDGRTLRATRVFRKVG